MAYHLLNIETSEYYNCDDDVWVTSIEIAKENGWEPDGTLFDIIYDAVDKCYDVENELYYYFALVISRNEAIQWDGNYIEKKNQFLCYEDTIYLAMNLDGTGVSSELIDFIRKGSFRICSE